MSCFWIGLINAIDIESFQKLGYTKKDRPSPGEFIQLLKSHVVRTSQVKWNGNSLSAKELDENFEHVKSLNIHSVNQGYDCSSCDPILLLVFQILRRNIEHNYLQKYCMLYQHNNPTTDQPLQFASNAGHFWNVGKR